MAVNLGTLEQIIVDRGGDEVLKKMGLIDTLAQRMGAKPITIGLSAPNTQTVVAGFTSIATAATQAARTSTETLQKVSAALKQLGIDAKVASGHIIVSGADLEKASSIAAKLGAANSVTTKEAIEAAKQEAIARREQTKVAEEYFQSLIEGAKHESTRADAVLQLIGFEDQLEEQLKQTNLTLQQRVELESTLQRVRTGIASGTESVSQPFLGPGLPTTTTASAAAASAAATEAAAVATEKLATGTARADRAVTSLSPKLRQGTTALTTLALAASTGDGSIKSIATSAGLAASVLAEAFAPAKWAGYASGIGAVVIGLTAAVGIINKLAEAKPVSQAVQARLQNTQLIDDAIIKLEQLRKKANDAAAAYEAATGTAKLLGPKMVAPGGMPIAIPFAGGFDQRKLRNEMEQAQAEVERFYRDTFIPMQREQSRAAQDARLDEVTRGGQRELDRISNRLATESAIEQLSFSKGQHSLAQHFAERQRIVEAGIEAERRALEQEMGAVRASARPTDTEAERLARASRIRDLEAQIAALGPRGQQRTLELTEQRLAAEKQLADQIRQFQNRQRQAQGQTHEARMAEIEQESKAFGKALVQGGIPGMQAFAMQAVFDAILKRQAAFEEGERRIGIIMKDLATKREEIGNAVARGQMSELDGQRQIAAEERRRIPDLERIAKAMLAMGLALNNPQMIAAARELSATIAGLNNSVEPMQRRLMAALNSLQERLPEVAAAFRAEMNKIIEAGGEIPISLVIKAESIEVASDRVQQQVTGAGVRIADTLSSSLTAGFSSAFTKGSGKSFFEALGNSLLAGVGDVIVQLGSAMLSYGLIMAAFSPVAALTPFAGYALSAPQSIAAGAALIALGSGLGAIAANNSGHRTGGGGSTAFSAGSSDVTKHIWLDPDRHIERDAERTATAITRSATAPAVQPMPFVQVPITVIGENDPRAQAQMSKLVTNAVRAGYPFGNG